MTTKASKAEKPAANESVILLDPDKALVSKLNTRQPKAEHVAELMESIRSAGQISPAIVRPHPTKKGFYELAVGARRKVACMELKRPLRAIVREIPNDEFEDMILTDNLQRVDPDPMQEAMLIERRLKAGVPASEIAARYGKTETWIKRRLKLASLIAEARDAWGEGGAFGHFNTEMMEYIGTLPPDVQKDLADDPYKTRDFGSLKEIIEAQSSDGISLKDVNWLNDPVSFVEGCGPGCATDTAKSLFPDPNDPCGTCMNCDCFNKRQALVREARLTALLDGRELKDFILVHSTGYPDNTTYKGEKLKILNRWDTERYYSIAKKTDADTLAAIEFKDEDNPKIIHLKSKGGKKAENGAKPGKQESRESKLTGKRLAVMQAAILAHLDKAPVPEDASLFNLLVAFGTTRSRTLCTVQREFDDAWGSYLAEEGTNVREFDWNGKFRTRAEAAWLAVKPVLRQRLYFQKNSELAAKHKEAEMHMTARLIKFPWVEKWTEICTKTVPVPKSWGPNIDPITLMTPAQAKAAANKVKEAADKKKNTDKVLKRVAKAFDKKPAKKPNEKDAA